MSEKKYLTWAKHHKVWSVVIAFFVITIIAGVVNPPKDKKAEPAQSTPQQVQPVAQETVQQEQPVQPSVPKYEILKEYGTGGKVMLIDIADATDEKLTLLGKEFDSKYGKDTFTRIGVFTDRKYALISSDIGAIDSMSDTESKEYDQAYVAQFNINKSSNFKQYVLRPSRDAKVINL
jgi:hypothetical protein